ncbi:MAG: phosphopantetheine adenylyltransferase [Bacteroidetes bacterium OLB12]|nr:MAG: phosphopantetheine adenylyltransferase [Bacteroidetes bacterium OLB12]HNU42596.1 pantetheine-phosphate adenylyltransferase [Cyclobacteriaceae bacterium]
MKRIAIFPGSFDPFTKGHQDIVLRGLGLFEEIIVAIGYNSAKSQRYFPIEFMVGKIQETFKNEPRISVQTFSELTAEFARRNGARYLLRGLRNTTDFEYENSIAQVNRQLNPELESVFLITSPAYAAISSSIIREVHRYKGDVSTLIPYKL